METSELQTYHLKSIRKQIIRIMLPIIAENCLQLLTGFVAAAMVGRLLEIDISAQGMCTKITDLSYYLFKGAGVALVVLIAKRMACGEVNASRTIFEKTAVSVLVLGAALCGLFWFEAELFLRIFTEDAGLISHAAKYMRILLFCLPFWGVMACVTSVYQGKGDTRTPMVVAAFVNVLNMLLCFGLIFGNLGMPKLGYLGAALSLVLSRAAGSIVSVLLLYSRRFGVFSPAGKREPVTGVLREVYSIGLPSAGESAVWQIASIILSRIILFYGSAAFAAYQLGLQAEFLTEFPAIGFSVAATSLISKSIGLQDKKLYEIYKKELMISCTLISTVTSALLILLPRGFMHMLTDNETLVTIAVPYVIIMGMIQIPQNLNKIYAGILRSGGYKTTPLQVQITGTWILRIPLCLLCAYVLKLPILSIWIVIAADQAFKCLLYRICLKRKPIL